ncbi:MAG: ChaN family lipoprotein [Kiloniellaceae bacterium]
MLKLLTSIGLAYAITAAAGHDGAVAAPAEMLGDHPLSHSLWDTRSAERVGEKVLFAEATAAGWVVIGEKHDNAEHHRLQARVVDALGRAGRRVAVVWEMADPDHAEALRSVNLDTVEGLGRALAWEKRGWPAWAEYQPIAEAALIHRLPMLPGKPSRDLVRRVARGEPLSAEIASRLDWSRRYPAAAEADLQGALAASHCGALPVSALGPMAEVQRFWDAWMAAEMRRATGPPLNADGAVLITGRGHAREDRAVPWHLPGDSLTLALVEVVADREKATDYPSFDPDLFDFVWFTPRVDDKDPCAAFLK